MRLYFEKLGKFDNLPENYLPVALPYIQDASTEARMLVMSNGADISTAQINATDIKSHEFPAHAKGQRLFLGFKASDENLDHDFPAYAGAPMQPETSIAIIDTGIAFWNPRFWGETQDTQMEPGQFQSVAFLGSHTSNVLDQQRLMELTDAAHTPGGEDKLFKSLATEFPESVYNHGFRPQYFSHGTAMADLAGRNGNPLFGIELPASALNDRSGDMLQAVLIHAIDTAIKGHRKWYGDNACDFPLHIVLAYGFSGGPLNGRHAASKTIKKRLRKAVKKHGIDVKLFVPIGNSLQDKIHARPKIEDDNSAPLTWEIMPDDYSANTIEFVWKAGCKPKFLLTNPDGKTASIKPKVNTLYQLTSGNKVIGALHHYLSGRILKTRLTLSPSRYTPETKTNIGAPAPFGRWKIGLSNVSKVKAWILRDDHPELVFGQGINRQSQFYGKNYVEKGPFGDWIRDGGQDNKSAVKRRGTASVLSASKSPYVYVAGAAQTVQGAKSGTRPAWYNALGKPNQPYGAGCTMVTIEQDLIENGVSALGNGSHRRFRVSGTSVAAAILAANWVNEQAIS